MERERRLALLSFEICKVISQSLIRDIDNDRFEIDTAREDLNEIVKQVNKMAEIIDHMRIFTRLESENPNEKLEVNNIIKNALKFTEQQLKIHNINLNKEFGKDLP